MQLHHNNPNEHYAEESQTRPCQFYWAVKRNDRLETDHGPVLCRDFLGDTLVWIAKEDKSNSIYGWKFRGDVEKDFTSLVLNDFGKIEENVKTILNPIEAEIGVELTTVEKTDDGKHVWIKGDKFWMLTTIHFSWYTTLLRYLTYNNVFKNFDELDKKPTNHWMKEAFPRFKKLPYVLKQMKITKVRGAGEGQTGTTMHDYNGWYSNTEFNYKYKFTEYGEQLKQLMGA